jgi:AP-2 complex subunit alpha
MPKEGEMRKKLNDSLVFILTKTEVTKSVNKNNADHGILFEAINLVIHYSLLGTKDHLQKAAIMLGRFISVKEPNIRYLGLDTMARLTQVPDTQPMVRDHIKTVNFSLQDADISIRKRALDLLFNMCDTDNAEEIVGELLKYLHKADFNIKEELVVRIALLAERFAKDLRWYIDVVLQLITLAGDFVNEDIWFRVVQIVTNNDELQEYAATNVLKALQSPSIHESGVKVGGYILGEFGYQIKDESVTGASLLDVLLARFKASSTETKALLFTAFIKLANTFPELRPRVDEIFAQYLASADTELQQRAVEYHAMYVQKKEDVMQSVLEVMPSFPERESALMRRIKKLHRAVGGKVATAGADSEGKEAEEGGGGEEAAAAAHSDEEQTADKEASGDEADTAAATTKAAASAPPAKSANLFDDITDFGGGAKPAAAAGGDADADSVLPAQDAGALSASLGMPACTVYDSDPLQVNMQVKVAGNQMKMVLTFVSKGGAEVRVTHSAFADGDGAVKVQMKPIEFAVAPGGQVPQYLLWHCTAPFTSTPTINYTLTVDGAEASLDLKLPVDVTNFCAPAPLDAASFISTWRANEVQAVEAVKSSGQVDKEVLKERIASLMHLAVIDGVEKNEDNFSASAVFKNGAASVPAVLRVETKPGSAYVRLTARSSQRVLSDALLRTAKILIGATSF